MNRLDGAWVLWWLRRLQQRAGLPLLLAFGLLAIALGLQLASDTTRAESRRLETVAEVAVLPATPEATPSDNDARLAEFYEVLPARSRMPDILRALFRLGEKQGVVLARGEYRLEETADGMIRCHIRFPVTGEAGKLENFLRAALRDFPALALEGVRFQRESANLNSGEVEIRFVLFLKPDTATALAGAPSP